MNKHESASEISLEEMCRELLSAALRDGLIRMTDGMSPSELSSGDLAGMANRLSDLLHPKRPEIMPGGDWNDHYDFGDHLGRN
jgi:hypothetical protein